jgi:hypothetical protein
MSKRNEKAIEVLKAGGFFRKMLERSYMGGEKFVTRLIAADRSVVKGVGASTFRALKDGLRRDRDCHYGSACEERWVLA